MSKIDLRKQFKNLYQPSAKEPVIIEVPSLDFLMIDGAIEPGMEPGNSPDFEAAMEALYGAAYTIKFLSKNRKDDPIDYTVMALEGLWWVNDGEFDLRRKDNWKWTLMIMQPDHIDQAIFDEALSALRRKKPQLKTGGLRLSSFREGHCVQMMHIGPYADEPATVERMREFAAIEGYRFCNKHHEIYLGDPRRSDPARLKTVLRHPVQRL